MELRRPDSLAGQEPGMHGALVHALQRSEEGRLRRFFMRRFRNAA